MATQVDTSTFDNFGKITYLQSKSINMDIIKDSAYTNDKFMLFKQLCKTILAGERNYNIVLLHNLIYNITNQNISLVDKVLIESFDEVTKSLQKDIQERISDNNFSIKYFVDMYKKYYSNGQTLAELVSYFDSKVLANNSNKYSHIKLIRSYIFYRNIVNHLYKSVDKGHDYCLYEIFSELIESNDIDINEIVQLFKMYLYYIRLSYIAKDNRDKLFDEELNKMFLITLGSNQDFIKKLTHYLHTCIVTCNTADNNNTIMENNVSELITMVSNYFMEKDMFNMYYEKFLEMRLLNNDTNEMLEKKFISKFKRPVDNRIIQNMIYKLDDIATAKKDRIWYENMEITITSDKYKKYIKSGSINHRIVNAKIFRYYAWSQSRDNESHNMNVPFDCAPYVDIYNQFYNKKYPYRELVWNYDQGVAVINLTIGAKIYQVQVTTPQLFLLLQFNNNTEITAKDLASNLGISLSKLGQIINVLLRARILIREENKSASDPTIKISLNNNFKYDNNKISLVNVNMNIQKSKQQIIDKDIEEKFAIGRENICQACLVRTIKTNNKLDKQALYNHVKIKLPFELDETMFNRVLTNCITEQYITQHNNVYTYMDDEDE